MYATVIWYRAHIVYSDGTLCTTSIQSDCIVPTYSDSSFIFIIIGQYCRRLPI